MVIKGGARAEADKLAAHLLRVDTNERIDVRELLGVCAPDLTAALLEMEAIASAARSRRPFYHASINTAPGELMNDAQKARTIDRLEQELGLTGQPRVVVEHVKEGREHLHVAWSRIDGETLCAIPDSHNFRRHEIVARELEREFAHARVQGAHHEREGVERPDRRALHAEMMQAERSAMTPEQAKEQLRGLWRSADNGQAFAAALERAGWILAQGDRRGFVALDPAGEVRAVNKDITGLSAAKVRERLADLDADRLPSVDEARGRIREREPVQVPALEVRQAGAEQAPQTSQQLIVQARDLQPDPAPVHLAERECDQVDELAAYAERQRQGFEETQRLRVEAEAAGLVRSKQVAEPSPEAVRQVSREAEQSSTRPEASEHRVAAILRELDERLRTVPPSVRVAAPELARESEPERVRERPRTPEPIAQPSPEPVRPSLFQMLTMGVRAWWQGLKPAPQPEHADDRQHNADCDREATHVTMPARTPEPERQQQEPVRQPAPEPEQARPAERMRRSIVDDWLAEARAELAAERARETPEQRDERERSEAERSRGRGDGGRERTRSRYHHRPLGELLELFQPHRPKKLRL